MLSAYPPHTNSGCGKREAHIYWSIVMQRQHPLLELVSTSSPEEGLRVLKRCYKEHIIISVACMGETHVDRSTTQKYEVYRQKTKFIVRRLKKRGYIIQYSMTLKKSVTRTKSHVAS